jgi:hypothetical protein
MTTRGGSEQPVRREETRLGVKSASVFADLLGTRPTPRRVTITDLIGLVVGFAWSGKVLRDAVGSDEIGRQGRVVAIGVGFVWLGMAMAGPFVLAFRRLQHGRRVQLAAGEVLWVVLGVFWMMASLCYTFQDVDPAALANVATRLAAASAALGPIALVVLWHLQRRRAATTTQFTWCHQAGILLAATWPAAWVATLLIMNG